MVKVMHKKLGEKFYKRKGKVLECKDCYTAVVEMLESGDIIKIDQAHLETVIPAIGKYSLSSDRVITLDRLYIQFA